MTTEEDHTLFELRSRARELGLWVGRHKFFDPAFGGGPFYIMERKRSPDQRNETLLKFATAKMVKKYLADNYIDLIRVVPSGRD